MDEIEKFVAQAQTSVTSHGYIITRNGRYYVNKVGKDGMPFPQEVSDFTIEIVASHYRDDEIYREIVLIKDEQRSRKVLISPDSLYDKFSNFVASIGDYTWTGTAMDAKKLWQMLFSSHPGKIIYEPECIGWLEDKGLFVFENIAFKGDKEIRPDASGTFWIDKVGLRPRSISATKSEEPEGLPHIITNKPVDVSELRDRLRSSINPLAADICLGWAVSVFYMEEVFQTYGCFPFLFISGKRRSGKSTIAQWLMSLFGLESSGRMWSDTTAIAMSRYLGYFSSLPLWLDEYRNDAKYASKTGMLRNVYNRQSSGKGTREGYQVREAKIRGTVIITGEETPDDNALMTRCVIVPISERDRINNNFNWFTDNRRLLSNFAYQIMSNKHKNVTKFLSDLVANKDVLAKEVDDRLAINQAVIATGFSILYGENPDFAKALFGKALEDKTAQDDEAIVTIFFEDVAHMLFKKEITNHYWIENDGKLSIYFHGLYNDWALSWRRRRGDNPFKRESIRSYLADEPGYLGQGINTRMADGTVKSCVVFDIETAPDYIKQLCRAI